MDAVLTPHATEQPIGPNKQNRRIKTPKKNGRGNFMCNPSENFDTYAGLLNPPSRAVSSSFSYHQYGQNKQQPPLLPLPHVSAIHRPQPLLSRSLNSQGLSLPPSNRKNRTRDMSLTPKKSKPTKREETKKRSGTQSISEFLVSASDNRWGPDPKDLPKHLPVVLRVLSPGNGLSSTVIGNMDVFSESVFNFSPPPSSLPLPKFSLRSKLSCNAEAAGSVDAGATNNLRRLLRLR